MMAALIACAGIAVPALAQDSVSNNPSPQAAGDSDANSPWDAAKQEQTYVLNLTPFTSSWGTSFATAPLAKSSRSASAFESSLMSAQSISRGVISGDPKASYSAWRTAGEGVNPTENDAAGTVGGPAFSSQFGFAFTEFATSDAGFDATNVIGGVVNLFPNNSCKLYVNRIVAASNSMDGTADNASINIGSVDAHGNVAIRVDDFGVDATTGVLGNSIAIVDTKARGALVNELIGPVGADRVNPLIGNTAADAAATSFSINRSDDTYSVPGIFPEELGGPAYIGTNFNNEFAHIDDTGNVTTHLPAGRDQRGTIAFSNVSLLGAASGVASAGTLMREPTNTTTRAFSIWDVDVTGALTGTPDWHTAPAGLDDPCTTRDSWPNSINNPGGWNTSFFEFDHYHSQVPFNGGNSPMALGQDQNGALLAAGIAYKTGGNQDPQQGIAVLRDTDPGAAGGESWSLAAWNGDADWIFTTEGRGKAVLDGPGGSPIGYISTLLEATDGAITGPSMSGCSIDAVGNIWFVAPVEYPSAVLGEFEAIDTADIHVSLIRAVYNADGGKAGEACWELEAIMKSGDVFSGANSDTDYLVGFIQIADSNSVSSGTFWSQNSTQDAYAGMSTVGMATSDPRSTGGVLLSTSIVYDSDGDGMFSFDSELAADDDESYNVVMYVGAAASVCADINGDGTVDTADLGILLGQFGSAGGDGDLNCDGVVDTADLGILLGQFGLAC
jgi:hypothetical protein